MSKLSTPGLLTAMPSAIVGDDRDLVGCPPRARRGRRRRWRPARRSPGSSRPSRAARCLTALATPEMRPPPPIGTITVSTSGTWSRISSPSVPWPATTSAWSNGGMRIAPVVRRTPRRRAAVSSTVWPRSTTSAPYSRVAWSLGRATPDRHEDRGLDAELAGRERDTLRVVARGGGDDAARLLLVGQLAPAGCTRRGSCTSRCAAGSRTSGTPASRAPPRGSARSPSASARRRRDTIVAGRLDLVEGRPAKVGESSRQRSHALSLLAAVFRKPMLVGNADPVGDAAERSARWRSVAVVARSLAATPAM